MQSDNYFHKIEISLIYCHWFVCISGTILIINNSSEVYHEGDLFLEDYNEMKKKFKIYIYPHEPNEPFAKTLLPVDYEPRGNYASEVYFNKVLPKSQFVITDPTTADLFYMPFSISRLRSDPRIGVEGIHDFVRDYTWNISHEYPYWNRSGGTDHFYVACHSIGQSAMEKASYVKFNSIQLVCTSSYFIGGYISHKDAGMPQIWPRDEDEPPNLLSSKRYFNIISLFKYHFTLLIQSSYYYYYYYYYY